MEELFLHDSDSSDEGPARPDAIQASIERDGQGEIRTVRIGPWRRLTSGLQRRLVEVRELAARRVAVRIERRADGGEHATSEIWELYALDGRLEAAMQTAADGRFALLTNYRTRQACHLVCNAAGDMELADVWAI